jgi:transposase
LALAAIYDGGSRGYAARIGAVGLQIVRDRVVRFNAQGLDGLIDRKAPGPSPRLNRERWRALVAMGERGPIPAEHGVVCWRLADLVQWVCKEFRIAISPQTLSRKLHALGYRKLSARPTPSRPGRPERSSILEGVQNPPEEIARDKGVNLAAIEI